MIRNSTRRGLATVTALVLIGAACGGDTDTETETGVLPTAPADLSDDVATEPACLPDEPECDDMVVVPDEGQDLEPSDDGNLTSSGMTVDDGLTVEEALTRGPEDGIIAVKGFYYRDDTGTFLCSVLAESLPPLCGGATLEIDGVADDMITVEVNEARGVRWTDETVSLFGTVADGQLTVDALVTG